MQRANKDNQFNNYYAAMPEVYDADSAADHDQPNKKKKRHYNDHNAVIFHDLEDYRFAYLEDEQEKLDVEALRRLPKHQRSIPIDVTRFQ